ncbi:MAG TPA: DUF1289 domain-containing protein [Methylophilaceae bacterium]|nr:DUF1289 domain-containing protein [Methylophilaceae bacterium]
MSDLDEVQSPCIGVCAIDVDTGLCQGCFRRRGEIQDWWDLDNVTKRKIVAEAKERESAVFGS